MSHLTEEQLILHYYGEPDAAGVQAHLSECAQCQREYDELRQVLLLTSKLDVPERPQSYGERVWRQLEPRLQQKRSWWPQWLVPRQMAVVAAVASLMFVAFLVGRYGARPEPGPVRNARVEQRRKAFMLATVRDHLDRSQRVLLEISNTSGADLPVEHEDAEELLTDTRLFRQAMSRSGDPALQEVFDELELVLTEAAHASPDEQAELRKRIEEHDLLFKVRVLSARLEQKRRSELKIVSN